MADDVGLVGDEGRGAEGVVGMDVVMTTWRIGLTVRFTISARNHCPSASSRPIP